MVDADAVPPRNAENPVNTVDVLFFYDAATLAANDNDASTLISKIILNIEWANAALQNSAVSNLRWHFVAAYPVPDYTATDKLEDDLRLITKSDNPVGEFVAAKGVLHGVDQAVLFVGSRRKDNYDGIAWVPNDLGAVSHHATVVWNSAYVTLAHEMAHNFGCRHDWQTEASSSTATNEGGGSYAYAHRFNYNGTDTGTVMSYAASRLPYFSNPELSYKGFPLGVAEDQPRGANNARVLRDNARLMAQYRATTPAPVITEHPRPTKVSKGAGFSLNVVAIGDGLVYQWRKDGVALPGANYAVYAKASAEGSDQGQYDVVVSNAVGQVESERAVVAILPDVEWPSPAQSPLPSILPGNSGNSSNPSDNGGGGGAVGFWFFAALAWMGVVRLITKSFGQH